MDDIAIKLVARWRAGDAEAADELFQRYAGRLIALARTRLSAKLAGRVDPEDIVQSAYRSFFAGARSGGYDLQHGGDLWGLLVAITLHKLQDQVRHHTSHKRSVNSERTFGSEDSLLGIQASLLAPGPSPVEALALVEQLERVMSGLEPLQRRMLELRLQGFNLEEIAADTRLSRRTVRRVLERIKQQLERGDAASGEAPS
jgi:RNA polymerase sigma-70 factor (ECF subfamily)